MTDGKKETEAEREEPSLSQKAEVKRQASGGSEAEQSVNQQPESVLINQFNQ